MNELDFMKAISDIPEDLLKCYFEENTEVTNTVIPSDKLNFDMVAVQNNQKSERGKIKPKLIDINKKREYHFRIRKSGIAAVIAVCIGLNAAMLYGISTIQKGFSPADSTEVQNMNSLHIELVDAMPTGVSVTCQNDSESSCELPLSAEIWQNGEKLEVITTISDFAKTGVTQFSLEPNSSINTIFAFDELPPGAYTLMTFDMNPDTDKKMPSAFGSIDFEISKEYMGMIYIPDMTGMESETAISQLNDLNIAYDIVNSPHSDEEIDHVISALPTPYKTIENVGVRQQYYHYDGNGYWIRPTDRIQLEIGIHDERGPIILPDMQGWDYETANAAIISMGLRAVIHNVYSDEVPKDMVISTDPQGPTVVERYSDVNIVISRGPKNDAETSN